MAGDLVHDAALRGRVGEERATRLAQVCTSVRELEGELELCFFGAIDERNFGQAHAEYEVRGGLHAHHPVVVDLERARGAALLRLSDLLPRVLSGSWPQARKGLVPDAEITSDLPPTHPAILRRLMEMKVIHFGRSHYPSRRILQGSAGACANHRANTIPGEYERAARKLDARFHAVHIDEETRPVLSRLRGFGGPHGLCVGAFSETSDSLRLLLRVTANYAAERHWREAGAVSQQAALSVFTATYRRRWGATFALAGARLRLARRELVGATQTRRAAPRAGVFHPGRHADFTRAERPIDRGLPRGQRVHTD
jgi:hypothetical protein